jgi:hypothetical protein
MKLLPICLIAGLIVTFMSGCAAESAGYYTPSQIEAQHADYDPTGHLSTSHY